MWCLPKHLAEKLLAKIADGTISPEAMLAMTSAQRREFFGTFLPEDAAQRVNALLESKLILKNQQEGMVTWAKSVSGLTPEAERSLVARVNKMEEILTPETEDAFLEDLAAHALGTAVTMEESANIVSLAQEVQAKKEAKDAGPRREAFGKPTDTEMNYGRALAAFDNYVSSVKAAAEHETAGEWGSRKFREYIENPFSIIGDSFEFLSSTSKEVRTSIDNSFLGRQGRNVFYQGLTGDRKAAQAWLSTFRASYKIVWETFKGNGNQIMDEIRAEIVSDPDYKSIQKMKVDTATVEEEMPSDLPSRIPFLGKPFEASRNAFIGSAHLLRYKVAKIYLELAKADGTDVSDKQQLEAIGSLVNSLTGRGDIGTKVGKPGLIDNAFFSRRLMQGDIDTLTAHRFRKVQTSAFVRKRAARNLLRIIIAEALILAIADLIDDDAVEWDPRSSDAFKIRVGNTRFDIGGGIGAMVRLAARIAPTLVGREAYIKKADGTFVKINRGDYKSLTGSDLIWDYLTNKLSPFASIVKSRVDQKYAFSDETPSILGDMKRLYVPLPLETAGELLDDEESANFLLTMILDAHGMSTNTYESRSKKK